MPGEIETITHIKIGENEHPIDAVTVNGQTPPDESSYLPTVSGTDDGKMMVVMNGHWVILSPAVLYSEINGIFCGDGDNPHYHDYSADYLTFTVQSPGTIAWTAAGSGYTRTIQYSVNGGEWTSLTSTSEGATISVIKDDVVRFKGTNNNYAGSNQNFSGFGLNGTATYDVSGNIMSLVYGDNFIGQTTLPADYTFCCLWNGDETNKTGRVVNAENLILPATTMRPHCYRSLLGNNPYLVSAPVLPATTLANSCYRYMFGGCALLTTAPDLLAATLVSECYYGMFSQCSSLNYIKCLATNPSSSYSSGWVRGVASSGTFVKDINTPWTEGVNAIPTNWVQEDEGTQVVDAPVISCSNNMVTITSATQNATIYYRFSENGDWFVYENPIEIYANTMVYAYVNKNGTDSTSTSMNCIYVEPVIPDEGDSDSDSDSDFVHDYSLDYLTFDILTGGNLLWKSNGSNATKTIQYSINDGEWTSITSSGAGVSIQVSAGDQVRFKGTNSRYCEADKTKYSGFEAGTATFDVSGNILSMIYGDNFIGQDTINQWSFTQFFKNSKPVSAENLILLAPNVPNSGYRAMFSKCSTLVTAPKELPATTLGQNAYYYMFEDCSITTSPVIVAASRGSYCYQYMFTNCQNLNHITCLDTNPSTGYYTSWVTNVSAIGVFVKDENAAWATGTNGIPVGWVIEGYQEPEEEQYDPAEAPVLRAFKYNNNEVTLPYSINAVDGHSGSYAKGQFAFNSKVIINEVQPTRLWFNQASQSANIYIDNSLVTTHWGGYNSFSVDITNYVHTGVNNLAVSLNNTTRNYLAPSAGDFNFNATLGEVRLLHAPVLPAANFGYDGFHVQSTVTSASASLTISTSVNATATVAITIDDGTYHYTDTYTGSGDISFNVTITNPHLWNGRLDPHLYNITMEIYKDNTLCFAATRPYGLRYFSYVWNDSNVVPGSTYTGFLLNGQPYLLRGVCMHQDIEGKANALSLTDIQHDFAILNELNCNFVRTAHYPHPKEFYDLCDQYGIVVQTEVPCVNKFQSSIVSDYYTHLEGQYTDMVNEHYNHPSIIFWGLGNEIVNDDQAWAKNKLESYRTLIKSIDPSRWVGYVVSQSYVDGIGSFGSPTMDWIGQNLYEGWYKNPSSNNPTNAVNSCLNKANSHNVPMAYSEYGCGGNPNCHSENHLSTTTCGSNKPRHDIEHQMWLHEGHIAAIKNFPQLVFTSMWVLFDFAVTSRQEGYTICLDGENTTTDDSYKYLNNKGLVERDHTTKKDTFYLYKAWWNPTSKFVHICGKNYQKLADMELKCYTNDGNSLDLYVNNTFIETVTVTDNIATFTTRTFSSGDVIRVEGATTNDTTTMTWA